MTNRLQQLQAFERVANQMASQHAYLSGKYKWRTSCVNLALLFSAFGLTIYSSLAFFYNQCREGEALFAHSETVPLLSVALLLFSFLNYGFGWQAKANEHQGAVRQLSSHRNELKAAIRKGNHITKDEFERLLQLNQFVNESIPTIPEGQFLVSKQHHKNKVIISRILDRNPATPIIWIRIYLFFRHSIGFFKGGETYDEDTR